MKIELKENERLDDLQRNGLKIIQKTDGFCFGMDAVLLSGFAQVKPGETVLDLGTGTGIIPLLLSAKTEGKRFVGLEIQEAVAEMAERSVAFNELENKIQKSFVASAGEGFALTFTSQGTFSANRELEALKAEYSANASIQELTLGKFELIVEAQRADNTLSVEVAAEMDVSELVNRLADAAETIASFRRSGGAGGTL